MKTKKEEKKVVNGSILAMAFLTFLMGFVSISWTIIKPNWIRLITGIILIIISQFYSYSYIKSKED